MNRALIGVGAGQRIRSLVLQALLLVAVVGVVGFLVIQTTVNLEQRGIVSGFDYLSRPAGFEITRSLLPYSLNDSYARALLVGLFNTVRVAALAGLIATGLGTAIGVARLSRVWVVSTAARVYVEAMRNTPLLLQLLFWYSLSQSLPEPGAASSPLPGVFISFRGVHLPAITWNDGVLALDYPTLVGFGFTGGTSITPEFAALLIALSTSTAAFIAEIVRGGILAVGQGQREAAAALGLSRGKAFRLVVLPQALPVIIPPTTSQYLNVTKNSSLAVAIGYPDLISITNTTLNQTGQAIEAIAVAVVAYLTIGLLTSLVMNVYDCQLAWRHAHGGVRQRTSRG